MRETSGGFSGYLRTTNCTSLPPQQFNDPFDCRIQGIEGKWRIFDPDNGPGIRVFPAEMLTGVIYGCEMPHEDRQLIRDWAKGRKIPLTLYQTTKKEKEFGLEIIKSIG